MQISIRLLGALSVECNGIPVAITACNQRRALLYLAVHVREVVSVDQLADAVWGADTPTQLEHAVHSLVYRLRRRLCGDTTDDAPELSIRRVDPGYCLAIDPLDVDGNRFTSESRRGRALLAADPANARDALTGALELWRGDALLDVAYDPWAVGEIRRLTEIRLDTCEAVAEADIELGQAELSIAELESLTERFPMRETLWALLWRAMSSAGRHLDVTASHRRAVALLADQCETVPSAHLAELAEVYARTD